MKKVIKAIMNEIIMEENMEDNQEEYQDYKEQEGQHEQPESKAEYIELLRILKEARTEMGLYVKLIDKVKDEGRGKINELDAEVKNLTESMQALMAKLERNIEGLDITVAKIDKVIAGTVPNVVSGVISGLEKIQQQQLVEIHKSVRETNQQLKQVVEEALGTAVEIKASSMRRYLVGLVIAIVVASVIASGSAYMMIKSFPSRVSFNVDKEADIAIKDSEVTIWDRGNVRNASEKAKNTESKKSEGTKAGQWR